MSEAHETNNVLTSLDVAVVEIRARADLLRDILQAGELGGPAEIAKRLQQLAPGLAVLAGDISRAIDSVDELATQLRRELVPAPAGPLKPADKKPRRRPELVSTEGPLDRAARDLGYGRDEG
jgi:hypothetical protein